MDRKRLLAGDFAEPLQQVDRLFVRFRRRKLLYFGGCDYYRLSSHRKILAAFRRGLNVYGLSPAASRTTTGNHLIYKRLEGAISSFFEVECAVLVSSGYLANMATAQSIEGEISHAFIDEFAHASLRESIVFAKCKATTFRHLDARDLARKLARSKAGAKIILITDGMFAQSGAVAPLAAYMSVLPRDGTLWVDDAHGTGVLGKAGRGSVERAKIAPRKLIQTITFSKAFGAYGGAILCDAKRRSQILSKSSVVTGNTPLPLPLASAALASIGILRTDRSLSKRLHRNISLFWKGMEIEAPLIPSPIIGMESPQPERLRRLLLEHGIFPPFIRYPGGPEQGYFRFALSSEHTLEQIELLANVLRGRTWPMRSR